jgi:hypothetical protein
LFKMERNGRRLRNQVKDRVRIRRERKWLREPCDPYLDLVRNQSYIAGLITSGKKGKSSRSRRERLPPRFRINH